MQPVKLAWHPDPRIDDDGKIIIDPDFSSLSADLMTNEVRFKLATSPRVMLEEETPVSDQGGIGSCVANATCDALEILLGLEKAKVVQLSRLFLYWNARNYNSDTLNDNGTYIRFAFQAIKEHGVCSESEWPYSDGNDRKGVAWYKKRPSLRCYENSDSNKITEAYRIDESGHKRLNAIDIALHAGHPVVFGTPVGKQLQAYRGEEMDLTPPSSSIGGHCMVIVGMENLPDGRRRYRIRNSWGTSWGQSGRCWFDESYIAWDQTNDLWVPTRVQSVIVHD